MPFTITISGIADRELGPLIARMNLPKSVKYDLQHTKDDVEKPVKAGTKTRSVDKHRPLMMTGKERTEGSDRAKVLEAFERMEVQHGPGGVTRQMFQEHLHGSKAFKGKASTMISQLLNAGHLKYADE